MRRIPVDCTRVRFLGTGKVAERAKYAELSDGTRRRVPDARTPTSRADRSGWSTCWLMTPTRSGPRWPASRWPVSRCRPRSSACPSSSSGWSRCPTSSRAPVVSRCPSPPRASRALARSTRVRRRDERPNRGCGCCCSCSACSAPSVLVPVDTVPASVYLAASDPDSECDPGGSCTACNPPPDWDLLPTGWRPSRDPGCSAERLAQPSRGPEPFPGSGPPCSEEIRCPS
jgi:hypothetical protein